MWDFNINDDKFRRSCILNQSTDDLNYKSFVWFYELEFLQPKLSVNFKYIF